jgi:hypothetical protein
MRPSAKTGLLFRHRSRKPKFHHSWRCSSKRFHQHLHGRQSTIISTILFLILTQQARHKAGCKRMRAQIWSKNALTRGFLKFWLPLQLHERSNDDCNELLSKRFGCFHFLTLKVALNVVCPQLKFGPCLKLLCHWRVCVLLMASSPNALLTKITRSYSLTNSPIKWDTHKF